MGLAGTPSLFTHQFHAEPCRCSCRVASIIERIDLGCASNLMRVLIILTTPRPVLADPDPPFFDNFDFWSSILLLIFTKMLNVSEICSHV